MQATGSRPSQSDSPVGDLIWESKNGRCQVPGGIHSRDEGRLADKAWVPETARKSVLVGYPGLGDSGPEVLRSQQQAGLQGHFNIIPHRLSPLCIVQPSQRVCAHSVPLSLNLATGNYIAGHKEPRRDAMFREMLFLCHRKSSQDDQEGMERQNAAERSCRGETLLATLAWHTPITTMDAKLIFNAFCFMNHVL